MAELTAVDGTPVTLDARTAARVKAIREGAEQARANGTQFDADTWFNKDQQANKDLKESIKLGLGTGGGLATNVLTGQAAYVGAKPAWHELGQVFDRSLSPEEALKAIRCWFDVKKSPVRVGDKTRTLIPDVFALVRTDTGEPLGVVGPEYQEFTHKETCAFLERVFGLSGAWIQSATQLGRSLRRPGASGAEKVMISAKMPEGIVLDEGGRADYIEWYINAINSLDGKSKFYLGNAPIRAVCGNSERLTKAWGALGLASHWSCMHKSLLLERVQDVEKAFGIIPAARDAFKALAESAIRIETVEADLEAFLTELFPVPEGANKATVTKVKANRDEVAALVDDPTNENINGTAWGLFNAATRRQRVSDSFRPRGAMSLSMARGIRTADELQDGADFQRFTDRAWDATAKLVERKQSKRLTLAVSGRK